MIFVERKIYTSFAGKGGKNRRRGKNENETEKRELVFKEDGQGESANVQSVTCMLYIEVVDTNLFFFFFYCRICSSYEDAG